MRLFALFFSVFLSIFAFEKVYKYAFNDAELANDAVQASETLKKSGAHLGTIAKSDMFEGEGGLVALKMGYIEILATNAQTLQSLVPSVWVKLDEAKNGDDRQLREDLAKLGFALVKVRFFKNKTIVALANASAFSRMSSETRKILIEKL
ncbi:MAG: hypothetical protein LBI57_04795 [Helicobacteraceae bacterium]|jgi:hypothetical protein|nr:hypothetical protein [Helicobacteraceae bacterium]